jgi:hypothetical protein
VAVRFDAETDAYVQTGGLPSGDVFSFTVWIYISTDRDAFSGVFSLSGPDSTRTQLCTLSNGTTLCLFDNNNNGGGIGEFVQSAATWYRVGVTVNGANAAFYHGTATGALSSATASNWTASTSPTAFRLARQVGSNQFWNGRLAAFKMWHGAELTASEIADELTQYVPVRTADLGRWHPFINAELVDYSGNGNTLTAGSTATATEEGPPIPWMRRAVSRLFVPTSVTTTAAAEAATGTGAASNAVPNVVPVPAAGTGTGAANQPAVTVSDTQPAEHAAGAGAASDAAPDVKVNAGVASGTGAAHEPTRVGQAEAATGTGAANSAAPGVTVKPALAQGTGAALDATIAVVTNAGHSSGTGQASDARPSVTVAAGHASGTGTANNALCTVRFFLTATASTFTTDPATGLWDDTTGDGKFTLGPAPAGASEEVSRSESNATADYDVLLGTWVSPPVSADLPVAVGQVLNLTVARFGAPSGSNLRPRWRLYVMSALGVNRGDLFNAINTGIIFNESTPTGMSVNATLTSGGTINAGDRFVLEVGFRHQAADGTTRTGSIYAGGTSSTHLSASDTDLSHPGHFTLPAFFGPFVTAAAEAASGTGQAFDATISTASTTTASAEVASGAGAASDAAPDVKVNAGHASATGQAFDASPTTATVTNAPAEAATGAGAAGQPAAGVAPNGGNASAAGAAADAAGTAGPSVASGTGDAHQPTASVVVNAEAATGSGAAGDAAPVVGATDSVEPQGSGLARMARGAVTVYPELASGSGAVGDAVVNPEDGAFAAGQVAGGDGAALTPNILVSGARQPGGWQSLLNILHTPYEGGGDGRACPHCGEPYRSGPHGEPFCPFDGYSPKGRGPSTGRRDWGGLVAALANDNPRKAITPTLDEMRAAWDR